jgi:hypothetical protein
MIDPNQALLGTYAPIYLGNSLCQFFMNTDKFGSIDPIDSITNMFSAKLLDFLPCVKAGFLLRNSITLLFYIYMKNNDLQEKENKQYSHFDDFMNKIFVEMDSEFYINDNHNKMLMSEAIEQGIIEYPLSTQDVIRLKRPEFNQDNTPIKIKTSDDLIYRKSFKNYYFQLLASNNFYSKNDLIRLNKIDCLDILNDETIQKQMIEEYNIIVEVLGKWKNHNK